MDVRKNSRDLRAATFSAYLDTESGTAAVDRGGEQEIDVFLAEKYFNMNLEGEASCNLGEMSRNMDAITDQRLRRKPGTPVGRSETSSKDFKNQKKQNRSVGRPRILSRFSCNGHCLGSKSIGVSEAAHVKRTIQGQNTGKSQNKVRASGSNRDERQEQFEFPILISRDQEEARKSIEVFGFGAKNKAEDEVSMSLERGLAMLTWDAIPKAGKVPSSLRIDSGREYETESCASSDLFEIDNISGTCSVYPSSRTSEPGELSVVTPGFRIGAGRNCLQSGLILGCKSHTDTAVTATVAELANRTDQKPKNG